MTMTMTMTMAMAVAVVSDGVGVGVAGSPRGSGCFACCSGGWKLPRSLIVNRPAHFRNFWDPPPSLALQVLHRLSQALAVRKTLTLSPDTR